MDLIGGPVAQPDNVQARSALIFADPKMRELKGYMKSHKHEQRLRDAAELEVRQPAPKAAAAAANTVVHLEDDPIKDTPMDPKELLRQEGCASVDQRLRECAREQAPLPYETQEAELPEVFRRAFFQENLEMVLDQRLAMRRRMGRFQTRLLWREHMDNCLQRLMVDMELTQQTVDMLRVQQKTDTEEQREKLRQRQEREAQARCDHLDKIYGWYTVHGMKEVRKERKAPPYLRFNKDAPVMPGSMRVVPKMSQHRIVMPGRGEGQTNSSPALLAAGSTTVEMQPQSLSASTPGGTRVVTPAT